jgi:NAD(P)-dependent dehydrogenase (short-subunit alcohol dehydrogenase family)
LTAPRAAALVGGLGGLAGSEYSSTPDTPLRGAEEDPMMPLLDNKVVFISGGSQGLGAAIARAAVREGARVVVTGRRPEPGEKLVAEFAEQGVAALFVQADVSDVAQAQAAVARAVAEFGRVDCLVNSAGLTSRGTLVDTTPELFDAHIAVNLRGPFFTMQAVVKDMLRRGAPGTIVNVISIAELGGQPYLAPYVAAKAGLAGVTRNAAHAHRWDRIRINGVDIGWTDSEGEDATQRAFHGAGDDWRAKAAASVPMGKLGQVDEIADFVVFLLSDRSGVVTGSVIDWDQDVIGGSD